MRSIPNQAKISQRLQITCGSVTCARNLKSNVRYINLVGQISELLAEHSALAFARLPRWDGRLGDPALPS